MEKSWTRESNRSEPKVREGWKGMELRIKGEITLNSLETLSPNIFQNSKIPFSMVISTKLMSILTASSLFIESIDKRLIGWSDYGTCQIIST